MLIRIDKSGWSNLYFWEFICQIEAICLERSEIKFKIRIIERNKGDKINTLLIDRFKGHVYRYMMSKGNFFWDVPKVNDWRVESQYAFLSFNLNGDNKCWLKIGLLLSNWDLQLRSRRFRKLEIEDCLWLFIRVKNKFFFIWVLNSLLIFKVPIKENSSLIENLHVFDFNGDLLSLVIAESERMSFVLKNMIDDHWFNAKVILFALDFYEVENKLAIR